MELCVKLVIRLLPGTLIRIVVFLTVIVVVGVGWRFGLEPATVISVILAAGLAAARVTRALLAGQPAPQHLPAPQQQPAPQQAG